MEAENDYAKSGNCKGHELIVPLLHSSGFAHGSVILFYLKHRQPFTGLLFFENNFSK